MTNVLNNVRSTSNHARYENTQKVESRMQETRQTHAVYSARVIHTGKAQLASPVASYLLTRVIGN